MTLPTPQPGTTEAGHEESRGATRVRSAPELREQVAITLRLLQYVGRYWPRFVLMLALTAVSSISRISGLVLIKPFGDVILGTFDVATYAQIPGLGSGTGLHYVQWFAATLSHSPNAALLLLVQLLFGVILVNTLSQFGAVYLQTYLGGRISVDLQYELFERILSQPIEFFRKKGKGSIHRILQDDTRQAFRTVYVICNRLGRGPVEAGVAVIIAVMIDWKLTLFAAAVLPVVAVTLRRFGARLRRQERDEVRLGGLSSTILQEVLAAPAVVKANQLERVFQEKFAAVVRKRFRRQLALRKSKEWIGPILDITMGAAVVTFVYLNGRVLIAHRMDLSSFCLLYVCLGSLLSPIRKSAKGYSELLLMFRGLRRVFRLLDNSPAISDAPDAVPLPPVAGRVDLRGVQFGYTDDRPVLRNLSLSIAPGERVALVGPSGSGKTTLANLLLRFYEPQRGHILIDGMDIACVTQVSLRRAVGLVTQDTVLFTGTVRENIAAGNVDPTGDRVVQAARAAHAHAFIMELPDGYDTVMGDRGADLSGGQRQRIAVARTLYRDPAILILDEATSALDDMTEHALRAGFLDLYAGRTTIVIAHRLSTILHADRVVLLYEGRIAGEGTHEELFATNALYRDLFERQMLPVIDDLAARSVEPLPS